MPNLKIGFLCVDIRYDSWSLRSQPQTQTHEIKKSFLRNFRCSDLGSFKSILWSKTKRAWIGFFWRGPQHCISPGLESKSRFSVSSDWIYLQSSEPVFFRRVGSGFGLICRSDPEPDLGNHQPYPQHRNWSQEPIENFYRVNVLSANFQRRNKNL